MWNITKEANDQFLKSNLMPIHESDQDWKNEINEANEDGEDLEARLRVELEEVKDELIRVIPSRFIPYVEKGTLNNPSLPVSVREDYLQWMKQETLVFEKALDRAYSNTQKSLAFLPNSAQTVFNEGFHDAIIERIERTEHDLHLYLNMSGAFATTSYVILSFKDVRSETPSHSLQTGQWLIYSELQQIEDGFAFRVLLDCPDLEWTIETRTIEAQSYFTPVVDGNEDTQDLPFDTYLMKLKPSYSYWLITPDAVCEIKSLAPLSLVEGTIHVTEDEMVLQIQGQEYRYQLYVDHSRQFVYTDVYENPLSIFEVPIPREELIEAALGEDIERQVRAWNTMYANPPAFIDEMNEVLMKVHVTEENEMLVTLHFSTFYEAGLLKEEVIARIQNEME